MNLIIFILQPLCIGLPLFYYYNIIINFVSVQGDG